MDHGIPTVVTKNNLIFKKTYPNIVVVNRSINNLVKPSEFERLITSEIERSLNHLGQGITPNQIAEATKSNLLGSMSPLFDSISGRPITNKLELYNKKLQQLYLNELKIDLAIIINLIRGSTSVKNNVASWDNVEQRCGGEFLTFCQVVSTYSISVQYVDLRTKESMTKQVGLSITNEDDKYNHELLSYRAIFDEIVKPLRVSKGL
ncbi:hypothetical protein [Shewanella denitrificans]|nr:hypothetical protein [Shewanella denitrificans]